ncbi:hypothetical protein SUDANB176_06592 [Streptomyces sp. enrichment culture]|uniref:PP2C family protein-serine/threonine phosphatase n=1 Tax=Streptomyces sp. enrichment culture TaxID=1795815 RepID=UPI003F56B3CB
MSGADQDTDRVPDAAFLDSVLRDLGAGVLTVDASGLITFANPWAERLLGRSAEQMRGRDAHDLLHRRHDGSPVPREECLLQAPLRGGGSVGLGGKEYFLRADGTTVPIVWSTAPLRVPGRRAGMVVVFHDFSLQREAEERAAARTAALEALTGRLNLVADVSALLVSTVDASGMGRRLLRLLVPRMGDWAALDLWPEVAGEGERFAVRSTRGGERPASLEEQLPPLPEERRRAVEHVMGDGEAVRTTGGELAADPDAPLAATHRVLFDRLGGRSAVVVPLRARQRSFGMLTVARAGSAPTHSDAEVTLLSDIGRRIGMAMDNVRLYHEQRNVAETMQRQLLAPLPQVGRLRMAARYIPAQSAMEIGGDWYDAFRLSDGVTALVIGDVVGHDRQAAAHMAEVRNMLRALAWDHLEPPSVIMRRLDEAVTHTSDAPMATLVFARVEGGEGGPWQLHWVTAGHPPPLLVTSEGDTRYLTGGHGPLIGMSAVLELGLNWPDAYEDLPPDSTLLLYTDGLVESRARSIDVGLAELRHRAGALARRMAGRTVDDFCDELLARIDPGGDDIALLALRLPAADEASPGDAAPPPQSPYSPAAPDRAAPGSTVEHPEVRDPTRATGRSEAAWE